jgi:hypothetical protein
MSQKGLSVYNASAVVQRLRDLYKYDSLFEGGEEQLESEMGATDRTMIPNHRLKTENLLQSIGK